MRTLYISHNSIGTALVRSQVLNYLRGLAANGIRTELVTYERGDTFPTGEFTPDQWHPIRARTGSSLPVKAIDIMGGLLLAVRLVIARRLQLIHARSYVPAAVAAATGAITRRPFIFDMRGFLGEEYVDAGHWRSNDLRLRALRIGERLLLRRAAHIVVLTEAAAARLRSDRRYAAPAKGKPVTVIPCAVDTDRFRPATMRSDVPTLVYSGSLALAYDLEGMLRLYAHARELRADLRFLFLNRDGHPGIKAAVARARLSDADIVVRSADFAEMPALVGACHVGIIFANDASSKSGSSPVKVAEYLACGLPVIASPRLGDTDALLLRYDAGAIVRPDDDQDLRAGAGALVELLTDERRRANARRLAETEFSLEEGVARYLGVYSSLTG